MATKVLGLFDSGVLFILAMLVSVSLAQDISCINQLVPCLDYLNGTKHPPSSCCDPLKSVIKSDPQCLCNMVSSKTSSAAGRAGVNITEAQELPGRCGQNVNPIACLANMPKNKNTSSNGATRFFSVDVMPALALLMFIHVVWASNNI
ncbi:hypothetical protein IFM89_030415 [Coptis chinensis]|uniref:Bifunctional inhibitor/plant lipid transfer protein/seed storage helical domain-containing protein n=1 Tax=Coptis chinensis TaxID=261450 RepID=A0A835HYD9_9MAGN|nr:hypothetical protein IFM89_030415 [Coptis chinensis]